MIENPDYVDVKEIEKGGTGVPVPLYCLTYRGETLRVVRNMSEAIEWLSHPDRQTSAYACYSQINGMQREVTRNPQRGAR